MAGFGLRKERHNNRRTSHSEYLDFLKHDTNILQADFLSPLTEKVERSLLAG
mgnify:CR=1 FL=1